MARMHMHSSNPKKCAGLVAIRKPAQELFRDAFQTAPISNTLEIVEPLSRRW
jgi:hypothetical protein